MSSPQPPFNPLDKLNLGDSVAAALLQQPVAPLPKPRNRAPVKFHGAGIYAIYYLGIVRPFRPYEPIAEANRNDRFEAPIYVGRAIPKGARKGGLGLVDVTVETSLYDRLKDHASSITQADNLDLDDFQCRYLMVEDIWIPLGERLLITRTQPIWNLILDGFGNHAPGKGRNDQSPSNWDTVHPGRQWAKKLRGIPPDADELCDRVTRFLRGEEVPMLTPEEATLREEGSDYDAEEP